MIVKGRGIYVKADTRSSKAGNEFTIAKIGTEEYTSLEIFVDPDVVEKVTKIKPLTPVDFNLTLAQNGYNTRIALVDMTPAK